MAKEPTQQTTYRTAEFFDHTRFDYSSLNTNDLDAVAKFSVLVMSEEHGAIVKEANPPKQ